jgi:hypothetical protein
VTEVPTAEILIPAMCRSTSRSYQGFVMRLGRDHAFFATRGESPSPGAPLMLALELPWRIGSLRLAVRAAKPATPARLHGICLTFDELSPRDRSRIERYLTRFHQLVAELTR